MGKAKDLTGCRYGMLTVIGFAGRSSSGNARWFCLCDCGKETVVQASALRSGLTNSCGCLRRKVASELHKTHEQRFTRLYAIWSNMKRRCQNRNNPSYKWYGAIGTTVCEEWRDFEPFYKWAMANGYRDDFTIDRIDNSKGYSPDNCRWATAKEQSNNKRNNCLIEYNGKTQTISQWAEEYGLMYATLRDRLNRYHWDIEKALTTPTRRQTSR